MTQQDVNALVLSHDQKQLLTNYAKNYLAVKAIEKEMKEEQTKIKEVMVANNVTKIDNGEYTLTLTSFPKYVKTGDVEEQFTQVTLNTTAVKAYHTLTGQVPEGVGQTMVYKLNSPKEIK